MNIKAQRHEGTKARSCRSFTLTELMIAVAVLIVVIIATSKIFGTASKIVGLGNATSSVMTEAATIERMMRDDLSKMTTEGFFAIRCVEVRNDYFRIAPPATGLTPQQMHVADPNAALINPNLPPNAVIRADQLLFFANGVNSMQTFRPNAGIQVLRQSSVSRVYWGHAFQLRNGSPANIQNPGRMHAHDPVPIAFNPTSNVLPIPMLWHRTTNSGSGVSMGTNLFGGFGASGTSGGGTDMFGPTTPVAGPNSINGTQPDPRKWLLARQSVVLVDDDDEITNQWFQNFKTIVPNTGIFEHVTARSIFIHNAGNSPWGYSREIRNGRLDAAASEVDDIRRWVLFNNGLFNPTATQQRPWSGSPPTDQRTIIQSAVYYPRAERKAPGAHRVDQALTNHVIGSACSSFAIDWTFDNGVGNAVNNAGTFFPGIQIRSDIEQPWFGLADNASSQRGVMNMSQWPWSLNDGAAAVTILPVNFFPNNIESRTINATTLRDYWATFGYNQTEPLDTRLLTSSGASNPNYGLPWLPTGLDNNAYTPFPSAIRVTMTLHDPEGKLEGGREVQFVIRLPKRNQ